MKIGIIQWVVIFIVLTVLNLLTFYFKWKLTSAIDISFCVGYVLSTIIDIIERK